MNLKHEQIEYEFSDEHSENDGIMLGYLQTGLDNTIKKKLHNQISKVQIVGIEDADNISYYYIEDMQNENKSSFDWELCENMFLLRAYNSFTPKMKRVFDSFYFEDKPTSEIAIAENCSPRAVNGILKRCREEIELQKRLEEAGNEKSHNT